jgi:hypothetical protein
VSYFIHADKSISVTGLYACLTADTFFPDEPPPPPPPEFIPVFPSPPPPPPPPLLPHVASTGIH